METREFSILFPWKLHWNSIHGQDTAELQAEFLPEPTPEALLES